ncbi:FAD-binding domain-containing protein [Tothia fuscella]|uniref:FAD-binding domain-containing protein n=1 Tax=Tothia fuscella TaxID=1048955 RepID=A0A9P4P4B0_9PEZI|nr:FAD-binding domain-containing protein [Tothia fuscella]
MPYFHAVTLLILRTGSLLSGAGFYYLASLKSDVKADVQPARTNTASTALINTIEPPEHDVSPANLASAYSKFVAIIGKENISKAVDALLQHTSTEWSSYPANHEESSRHILLPSSTQEVSDIMKVCHAQRIPVVAFSGGTSLEGHFVNTRHGIAIDFTKMDAILKVHEDDP